MSKLYIALIADAVRSRALPAVRRARLQAELRAALDELNGRYRTVLAARFGITQGDELQCLLTSKKPVWDIVHAIRYKFSDTDWVVGCGRGPVTTSLGAGKLAAPEVDGPCFHEARAAVDAAKRERSLLAFRGFGAAEPALNAFASYYAALYWSWTRRQRAAAAYWRYGRPVEAGLQLGVRLKVVPSAISHLRRRMAWPLVEQGDKMFRSLLEASTP